MLYVLKVGGKVMHSCGISNINIMLICYVKGAANGSSQSGHYPYLEFSSVHILVQV